MTFFSEPRIIKLKGEDVSITPLAVKSISKAAKVAAPLIGAFEGDINPQVLLQYGDEVIALCAIASNKSEEFIGELDAAELIELLTVILEVNGGFFSRVILPKILTMTQTVKQLAQTAQVQSPSGNKA